MSIIKSYGIYLTIVIITEILGFCYLETDEIIPETGIT